MFKNIKAEAAAKALANTKEDFKNAMGAYQSMVQTLTFAYSSDKEAIYEVTGISAKPVPPPPKGNVQSVPRRPMVNGKVIGKPCPTCGKTIKQVTKSNLKPAPRVQKVDKEIDELLAGLEIKTSETAGIVNEAFDKAVIEDSLKRQKAIDELLKDEITEEQKLTPAKETGKAIFTKIEEVKNKGGRPRIEKK